ncbi:MAG: hypothetical protein JW986_05335 [Methanotrichaceae archaeon]|nr:hypothetical protein [Methanotrichaceae archaeon]
MGAPKEDKSEDLRGLYDLAIPLGMPVSVIRELVESFELEPVRRKAKVDMVGEAEEREILVLRGDLETVRAAEKHMFEALDRKIEEWDRSTRYRDLAPKEGQPEGAEPTEAGSLEGEPTETGKE